MTIPGLSLTIRDPGLGLSTPGGLTALCVGVSTDGPLDRMVSLGSVAQVEDTLGEGPLAELVARVLAEAGGPVLAARMNSSVPPVTGAVDADRASTSTGDVTLSGTPTDSFELRVRIVKTGERGVAEFVYSLDGGTTESPALVIPSGGSYAMARSGLTLAFSAGSGPLRYEQGDVFAARTLAAHVNSSDVGDLFADVIIPSTRAWRFLALAGSPANAAAGVSLFSSLATQMGALAATKRYRFAILDSGGVGDADSGDDDADETATAYVNAVSTRMSVGFGQAVRSTAKPYMGWGTPRVPAHYETVARIAAGLISTHPGRVASGALDGVVSITHDERVNEGMRAAGFATLRTWDLVPGFYPTDGRIKAPPGSDFQQAHLRMVMDVACETTVRALTTQANKSVRVLTDGSGRIHPIDAAAWREVAMRQLRVAMTQPLNAEGTSGHVSGVEAIVDPDWDVLTSGTVAVDVALVPLGYAERISISVGYATSLRG